MNTLEIHNILSKHPATKKVFKGVFAADKLPKTILNYPALFIANTDPSTKPGTHWIAFYFNKNREAEFFDSYGENPQKKEFLRFLNKNSISYSSNKQPLQGYFSNTCGHYCILYGLFKCENHSLKYFLKNFSKRNSLYNDKLIIKMFKKSFKKNKRL